MQEKGKKTIMDQNAYLFTYCHWRLTKNIFKKTYNTTIFVRTFVAYLCLLNIRALGNILKSFTCAWGTVKHIYVYCLPPVCEPPALPAPPASCLLPPSSCLPPVCKPPALPAPPAPCRGSVQSQGRCHLWGRGRLGPDWQGHWRLLQNVKPCIMLTTIQALVLQFYKNRLTDFLAKHIYCDK